MSTLGSQPEWVKSSLSFANGNCVEVADLAGDEIGVRNSRDAAGSVLRFTPDEWHAFIGGVRNGEFDRFGAYLAKQAVTRRRVLGPWDPAFGVSGPHRGVHADDHLRRCRQQGSGATAKGRQPPSLTHFEIRQLTDVLH